MRLQLPAKLISTVADLTYSVTIDQDFEIGSIDVGDGSDRWMVLSIEVAGRQIMNEGDAIPADLLLVPFALGIGSGSLSAIEAHAGDTLVMKMAFGPTFPATFAPALVDPTEAITRFRQAQAEELGQKLLTRLEPWAAWGRIVAQRIIRGAQTAAASAPKQFALPLNTGSAPVPPRTPWWIEATVHIGIKIEQLLMIRLDDWWVHALTINGETALAEPCANGFPAILLSRYDHTMFARREISKDAVLRLQISYVGENPAGEPFLGSIVGTELPA